MLYSGITCKLIWGRTFQKRKVKRANLLEQRKMTKTKKLEVKTTRAVILMLEKKVQLAPKGCLIRVDTILFL